jgi:membrane-bound lytic murein transglycosylase F
MQPKPAQTGERRRDIRSRFGVPTIVVMSLMIGTCSRMPDTYEQIRLLGMLKVATRNSPMAYYEGASGPEGPEYELAAGFARRLGVKLKLKVATSGTAALEDVLHNRAHIAAAGIIASQPRHEMALFGPVYQRIDQHIVYRVQDPLPESPRDLIGKRIIVIRNSTHAASLARLARDLPALRWTEVDDADQLELFARVASGAADVTIADSSEFTLGRRFHPQLRPAFKLAESEAIAWALAPRSTGLLPLVEHYFTELKATGGLAEILSRHEGSLSRFRRVDAPALVSAIRDRLPLYRAWFEEASTETDIDWRILAAIGYQESRWDETAVSTTGVRGLMMLTAETAQRVKITDRTDPRSSILGAARYLALIKDTIPEHIPEPDRTWLTLAAYNIGYGHLEDARILAQSAGRDPDSWDAVREKLPLLAQERWFMHTRRGYARGWEPVGFVRNVQTYLQILEWMTSGPEPSGEPRKTS